MNIVAIVPINELAHAKSRLAEHVSDATREHLVFWMAGRVLAVLKESGAVQRCTVVSPDERVLTWARGQQVETVLQTSTGLNAALEDARRLIIATDTEAILVVHADLPEITAADIRDLTELASDGQMVRLRVVLAPDRRDEGTNALLVTPPDMLTFGFGRSSFSRHMAAARASGVEPHVFRSHGTMHDVDTLDDVGRLQMTFTTTPDGRAGIQFQRRQEVV